MRCRLSGWMLLFCLASSCCPLRPSMSTHHGDGSSSSGTATEKPPPTHHASPKEGFATTLLARLPKWLAAALKDPRKWKTFVRCMLVLFANLVLLVCQQSTSHPWQSDFSANEYPSRSRVSRPGSLLRPHRRVYSPTLPAPLSLPIHDAHHRRRHVSRLGMGHRSHGGGLACAG